MIIAEKLLVTLDGTNDLTSKSDNMLAEDLLRAVDASNKAQIRMTASTFNTPLSAGGEQRRTDTEKKYVAKTAQQPSRLMARPKSDRLLALCEDVIHEYKQKYPAKWSQLKKSGRVK